ncbi:MAG: hypothetical protein SVS15_06055 [Thermodesulfobacteriota bacterium]|nr:hypothetical protein [Thermodesulfobacteriota bacterium]
MPIFPARPLRSVSLLIASSVLSLIFLLVFFLEPARAEPLVSILYTGNSLGLYKACPT